MLERNRNLFNDVLFDNKMKRDAKLLIIPILFLVLILSIVSAQGPIDENLFVGITNDSCSTEKNLIAKDFKAPKDKDGSGYIHILLDYDEDGLCIEDNYITEFCYSINGGKTFHWASRTSRVALRLNGLSFDLLQIIYYKLTFRDLTIISRMDFINFDEYADLTNLYSEPPTTPEPKKNGSVDDDAMPIIPGISDSIKEINEKDNCVQQEFKIKLFARELVPVAPAIVCTDYSTIVCTA